MNKFIALATVAAVSLTAVSGAANAANKKSAAEFNTVIESIHHKQAQNRAAIKAQVADQEMVVSKDVKATAKGPSMEVLEQIRAKQAQNRAAIKAQVR